MRYNTALHPGLMVLFAMLGLSFGIGGCVLIQPCVNLVIGQQECMSSHRKELTSLESREAREWKAIRPISVSVGQFFNIEGENFIVDGYLRPVLEKVVDLVLSFP